VGCEDTIGTKWNTHGVTPTPTPLYVHSKSSSWRRTRGLTDTRLVVDTRRTDYQTRALGLFFVAWLLRHLLQQLVVVVLGVDVHVVLVVDAQVQAPVRLQRHLRTVVLHVEVRVLVVAGIVQMQLASGVDADELA
jgi:hypothetical protein